MHHIFCTIVLQPDFGRFEALCGAVGEVQKQRLLNLWHKPIKPSLSPLF